MSANKKREKTMIEDEWEPGDPLPTINRFSDTYHRHMIDLFDDEPGCEIGRRCWCLMHPRFLDEADGSARWIPPNQRHKYEPWEWRIE